MSFLALACQKAALKLEQSFTQLRIIQLQNKITSISEEMGVIESQADSGSFDTTDDPQYLMLEQLEEQLETEKETVQNKNTLLTEELNTLSTQINQSIKDSCKLSISQ